MSKESDTKERKDKTKTDEINISTDIEPKGVKILEQDRIAGNIGNVC